MDPSKIMRLLHAASFDDCTRQQHREILNQFLQAIPVDPQRHDKRGERDRELLEKLYWEIAHHAPALLPEYFPLFATLCGKRNMKGFATIDWPAWQNRSA